MYVYVCALGCLYRILSDYVVPRFYFIPIFKAGIICNLPLLKGST